jgi:branched-chain amino acid transport system substrate-binding protein
MKRFTVRKIFTAVAVIGFLFGFLGTGMLQAQDTYRLGGSVAVTGKLAHFGAWHTRGANLALEDLAAKGWIGGKKLEILWEDNEYEPRKAISTFNKLVFMDKVNVILSGGSPIVRALSPLAEQNKVIQLYCTTSNEDIKKGGNYTFKIMGGQVTEMYALAKYAHDNLKAKTVGLIGSDTEYGQGGMKLFKKYFEKMGGKITAMESVRPGERDYSSVLMRINNAKPDAIAVVQTSVEGGYVAKYIKRLGIQSKFLGGMNLYSAETLTTGGGDCEGMYVVGYQFDPENGTAAMKNFSKKFEKKYNAGFPNIISAVAYDAVMLYAKALENNAKTPDQIYDFFRKKLGRYEGVSGTIVFDSFSENMPTHRILQVKDGKFVEVHQFAKFTEKDTQ